MVGDVAAGGGQLLEELERLLLERAALAGAPLALGGELDLGLLGVAQALHLALELGDLLDQLVLRLAGALDRAHDLGLEVGQRVVAVLGGELAQQVLARVAQRPSRRCSLTWCCTAVLRSPPKCRAISSVSSSAVGVEHLRHRAAVLADEALELLLEVLADPAGALGEGVLGLGRRALELAPDRVDLGAGGLAIEHARTDLERVGDRLGGGDLALRAVLDQLDERAVLDRQPLYKDLVAVDADTRASPVVGDGLKGCLKGSHSFHVELWKVSLTPDGTGKMPRCTPSAPHVTALALLRPRPRRVWRRFRRASAPAGPRRAAGRRLRVRDRAASSASAARCPAATATGPRAPSRSSISGCDADRALGCAAGALGGVALLRDRRHLAAAVGHRPPRVLRPDRGELLSLLRAARCRDRHG